MEHNAHTANVCMENVASRILNIVQSKIHDENFAIWFSMPESAWHTQTLCHALCIDL